MPVHFLRRALRCAASPPLFFGYARWRLGHRVIKIGFKNGSLCAFSSFSQWWTYKHVCPLAGGYSNFISEVLKDASERVCIDVGANIGLHSLAWGLACPRAQIFAFEPLAENCELMRRNLVINNVTSVEILQSAVSDVTGVARFRANRASPQNAKIDQGELYPCRDVASVPCLRLDDFAHTQRLAKIDLLKIDTEGAEAKVLRGASSLIQAGRIRVIIAEFGPALLRDFGDSRASFFAAIRGGRGSFHNFLPDGRLSEPLSERALSKLMSGDLVFVSK